MESASDGTGQRERLFVTTLVGAFAWPITGICGATLLFFLRTKLLPDVIDPPPLVRSYSMTTAKLSRFAKAGWIALLLFSMLGVAFLARVGTVLNVPKLVRYLAARGFPWPINRAASLLLTAVPSIVGMSVGLAMLAGSVLFFRSIKASLRDTQPGLLVLSIAAVIIPWGIVRAISNPSIPNASHAIVLIRLSLFPSNGKFLLPLVTLAAYWGPVVLLLLLNWRAFCRVARSLGPGFTAVVGINVVLGLPAEPRFVTFAWPFLVLGAVLVL